jgi:predicted transcriptional regulator
MEPLPIGVMSPERIRQRMQAIAGGTYKPPPGEPRIWFASMTSLAEVLSDENRELLRIIADTKPVSLSALAKTTGREMEALSRALKSLSRCGIVELKRRRNQVRPVVKAVEFRIVAP